MACSFLIKTDKWITKRLSYPGIDEKTFRQKRINWLASIAVTGMIFCLTLAYHFIFPQLRILIYYGLFLTVIFLQGVIYPMIFNRVGLWLLIVDQTLVAVATFLSWYQLLHDFYTHRRLCCFSLSTWHPNPSVLIYGASLSTRAALSLSL